MAASRVAAFATPRARMAYVRLFMSIARYINSHLMSKAVDTKLSNSWAGLFRTTVGGPVQGFAGVRAGVHLERRTCVMCQVVSVQTSKGGGLVYEFPRWFLG